MRVAAFHSGNFGGTSSFPSSSLGTRLSAKRQLRRRTAVNRRSPQNDACQGKAGAPKTDALFSVSFPKLAERFGNAPASLKLHFRNGLRSGGF
jgi:hypothetical protein